MNVVAWLVFVASGLAPTANPAAEPLIPAFARFHGTPSLDDAAAGRLLLGELNCTSCHAVDSALGEHLSPKRAPVLSGVGDRVRPEFVRALLTNPQHAKPGTTMPDVLVGLSEQERKHRVEALTHFLASTGTEPMRDRYVDKDAAKRGEQLFHDVGCAACHGSRKKGVEPLSFAVPLGDPASKYTVTSLAEFLDDPLAVRPSGRMPKLRLTVDEARDVASYFLKDVAGDPNVRYEYYEGRWEELPDFSITKPVSTGTSTGFDITVGKKRDRVAYRFEGYLHLDADVNNEFRLTSDDGARLFVDDVLLIDHDGIHPATEKQVRSILKK
jgi:mono/diheme cytochrome c family protein